MKRILVVEDEDAIRDFIVINLQHSGYDVIDASNGDKALKIFDDCDGAFDIAILDIMMPGMDGFSLCKHLRARSTTLGIIMLTAKTQEMDKVTGLMIGADDYVTKPFSPSELVARVDAIHRRVTMISGGSNKSDVIISGPFTINLKSRTLTKNGKKIELTQVEFQIIMFFMKNENVAMERGTVLKKIWGDTYFGDEKIVDVNIRRLRMKIEDDPSNPTYIQTVWGYGYKWSVSENDN